MSSTNLTYEVFKSKTPPEQIRTIHDFYELEFEIFFTTPRSAKTFFSTVIFDANCNSFIKLKMLKAILWFCVEECLTPEFTYDLYVDIDDENPFILTQKIRGLFLLGAEKDSTKKILNYLKDHQDADVAAEAYFNSGLVNFFINGISKELDETIQYLNYSKEQFEASIEIVENRVDANLFRKLTQFLIDVLSQNTNNEEDNISAISNDLQNYQMTKLDNRLPLIDLEVFDCLINLSKASKVLLQVENWFDYRAELSKLNTCLFEILSVNSSQDIFPKDVVGDWKEKIKENIFNPFLNLSLQTKISAINSLRSSLKDSDSELKDFLDQVVQAVNKKKDNTSLEVNLVTLTKLFPILPPERLKEMLGSNRISQSTVNVLAQLMIEENNELFSDTTSAIEREILSDLRRQISSRVNIPREHQLHFYQVLVCIVRFVAVGYQRSDGIFKVLYNQPDASEGDYQDSLLLFLKTTGNHYKFDAEKQQFADGGRIDVVFSEGGQTTIPIEVKKTKKEFNTSTIHENFLPQAQTYVSPYNQVGIFVLFDARDKKDKPPNPGIKNLFYIDSIPSNLSSQDNYPDLVVNIVIPANKVSPSSKSKYG